MTSTPEQIAEHDRLMAESNRLQDEAVKIQSMLSQGQLKQTGMTFDAAKAKIVDLRVQAKEAHKAAHKALGM